MRQQHLVIGFVALGAAVAFVLVLALPWLGRQHSKTPDNPQPGPVARGPAEPNWSGRADRTDQSETIFEDKIDCNIVKIERLKAQDGAFLSWWTDGTRTRLNYPVDLYIDTRDVVDWRAERAAVTVIVRCDTIRKQKFERTLQIRATDLSKRVGNRGLISVPNAFQIDPKSNIIHEVGHHTICVTLKTRNETYEGSTAFSIGSSNPHSGK